MLRALVLALLLANAAYWAYAQGHLATLGWSPEHAERRQREPERLERQIQPERMRLVVLETAQEPAQAAPTPPPPAAPAPEAAAAAAPPASGRCLQAGPFDATQTERVRSALSALLPDEAWRLDSTGPGARWIVYMGKFANAEAITRKKGELKYLNVDFREVTAPTLQLGLALGTYSSEAAAQQALADLVPRGIRTARVLQERPDATQNTLKVLAATPAQQQALEGLNDALAGQSWQPCP